VVDELNEVDEGDNVDEVGICPLISLSWTIFDGLLFENNLVKWMFQSDENSIFFYLGHNKQK